LNAQFSDENFQLAKMLATVADNLLALATLEKREVILQGK
jgi:hypothetical protein